MFSGSNFPFPIVSNNGSLSVLFTSDEDFEMKGFEIEYSSVSSCPGKCSGKGYCVSGKCVCLYGSSGDDCSEGIYVENS